MVIRQLSKLREEKGITKEGLAKQSGISRSMISMMESGQRHPTVVTVHALCSALETSVSHLIAQFDTPPPPRKTGGQKTTSSKRP